MSAQRKACSKIHRKAGARAVLAAAIIALFAVGAPTASAAPPGNDDFANAISISALPFSDSVDLAEATLEPSEPQQYFNTAGSVWYSISPTSDLKLRADMSGSTFSDTLVNVYQQTSSGLGGLMLVTGAGPGLTATFTARAGNTYYLQAQRINSIGGTSKLDVSVVPPPANDDFARATIVPSLPFSDTVDVRERQSSRVSRLLPAATSPRRASGTRSHLTPPPATRRAARTTTPRTSPSTPEAHWTICIRSRVACSAAS
jgi:hypothetical protein